MDAAIFDHLAHRDPILAKIIPNIQLSEIVADKDIYPALLEAIVSQQLSVKAAATIFERFLALFPNKNPEPEWILAQPADILRGCGLSYQKISYIQNIAQYWLREAAHTWPWADMSDRDIVEKLTAIKGVGVWTVQMVLIFKLNRQDIFPIDDLGVRQGMVALYGVTETGRAQRQRLTQISEAWQPYRTIGSRLMWRYKDSL